MLFIWQEKDEQITRTIPFISGFELERKSQISDFLFISPM